ncbi:MAG: hypothetical protein COA45_00660 [Zetaproteobacteria bacterium]|nr:MAG: hypothetical protein COA45_00660 [Zetaproteobacteria bacterium]
MPLSLSSQDKQVQLCLALALLLNILFWFSGRDIQARWNNVPPAPSEKYAAAYGMGDAGFAYRLNGLMLQNLGDTGGRVTSLDDYHYDDLAKWFFLQDALDNKSDYTPYLAAYYFGSVQTPEKFRPVLDYLQKVGSQVEGEKWRWFAQGVFLARFKLNDLDKALEMANVLAKTEYEDAPAWVRQMPAFIMTQQGEKKAAYALLLEILKTSAADLHPNEVNAMKAYICSRTLSKEEAAQNPICEGPY